MKLFLEKLDSPLGTLLLVHDGAALRALDFGDYEARLHRLLRLHYGDYVIEPGAAPKAITAALARYFEGDATALEAIEVATGGTKFQREVWAALRRIPAGKTVSYGEIAKAVGKPSACRAVGAANGSNPIAIVVPCHRVVGANGKLTGYAGSLPRKEWLLKHERMEMCL